MFKTDYKYIYSKTPDFKMVPEYKISANDILVFDIYTNSGFNLINITTFVSSSSGQFAQGAASSKSTTEYLVDADGNVKLPIVGPKKIAGLTLRETETLLEESYSEFYLKPFVVAKITNRRVIFFPGDKAAAKIITLTDNNTTLIQLIAQQGGISLYGKAKQIKLIRDGKDKHEVFHINLATVHGVDDAHIVLQANDIVYIEPRKRVTSAALTEITPFLSLLSSSLLVIAVINNLKK